MVFADFAAVAAHLDALGLFHMDFGLSRMEHALATLGLDGRYSPGWQGGQASAGPRFVVQIVGTNGKGSTATFLERLAREHGLRTGLYTSPHLARVNERIRINGVMLDDALWPPLAEAVYAARPDLTYFEFLTVLAVLAFARAEVDCVILEAGLGGRYDATTAVPADLVCFTPIALDHMAVLGPDLASIAADKAKAMRPGGLAVTAPQPLEAMACLRAEAVRTGCTLIKSEAAQSHELPCAPGLAGPHQHINAALALTAWRVLIGQPAKQPAKCAGNEQPAERLNTLPDVMPDICPDIMPDASPNICPNIWPDTAAEVRALTRAFIPGRLQRVAAGHATPGLPPLVLDGAHNPHGLDSLAAALKALCIRPRAVIFTCLADKDAAALLPRIRLLAGARPVLVPELPGNARARSAAELAAELVSERVSKLVSALAAGVISGPAPHAVARPCADIAAALAEAARCPGGPDEPVLICGSLYLLGAVFSLYPHLLNEPGALGTP